MKREIFKAFFNNVLLIKKTEKLQKAVYKELVDQ
jgi:hypothetical protein